MVFNALLIPHIINKSLYYIPIISITWKPFILKGYLSNFTVYSKFKGRLNLIFVSKFSTNKNLMKDINTSILYIMLF